MIVLLQVRQHMRDARYDQRRLILGFQYAGLPAVNSLRAIYNFQVRRILGLRDLTAHNSDKFVNLFMHSNSDT